MSDLGMIAAAEGISAPARSVCSHSAERCPASLLLTQLSPCKALELARSSSSVPVTHSTLLGTPHTFSSMLGCHRLGRHGGVSVVQSSTA